MNLATCSSGDRIALGAFAGQLSEQAFAPTMPVAEHGPGGVLSVIDSMTMSAP